MFQHPDVTMALALQRATELRAEGARRRHLNRVRRARIEDERSTRAPAKPYTLHPLVFWALR